MKKILLALCAVLVTISGFAKEIEVVEGKAEMKKREGLALIVFNWEDALWDKKTPIKENGARNMTLTLPKAKKLL